MPKQIIIAEQHRIAAVFSEDQIQELIVAKGTHQVSDIYVGTVENVLPGIDAAFVNLGDPDRNGFIHVSDLGPLRLKRAAGSITELLAPRQKVLVQVMKEPTGNKGPRLTGNVSLPGRYLVLMPFGRGVNLSRRIRNENERNRLRALAILVKPAGMGVLVRTEAEGMAEEAIIEDLEFLQKQWENIQQEALTTRPPSLLNRDDDFIQRVLRDMYSADVNRIVVDQHTGMKRVKQHLMSWNGGKSPQGVSIDHHRERIPILEYFRVNAAVREALKPRVDLPSGGYVVIEPTEALTVIDVNSGSFTRSATARETVLWTNCEAAEEIARQLRLRNIAGVIIVDFIDMDSRRDQLQVLEQFNRSIRSDKARPQIAQLTELGLVELTRKRQGQNIYELFGHTCPACEGLGHLVHLPGEAEPVISTVLPATLEHAIQEPRLASRESTDADDLESDSSSDLQELDLLNHPSYQERGSRSRSRRRRRGPESSPTSAKSASPSRSPSSDEPLPSPMPKTRNDNGDRAPVSVSSSVSSSNERSSNSRTEVASEAPPERSERRSSRSRRSSSTPPEVVFVEMTEQEQDIYALMGISPLVLATDTVKDPKSAIVNVAAPGEAPKLTETTQPQDTHVESKPSNDQPPLPKTKAFLEAQAEEAKSSASEEPDTPPAPKKVVTVGASASAPVSEDEQEEEEAPAAKSSSTRRRRRRSSASE
ncbi:MAG: Rne/Rng family ribonuclease [Elainellaceae cyanobacterium]